MKTIKITSSKIQETQLCPTSKSYANRLLILGALKKERVTILNLPDSQDVKDLILILKEIGLKIVEDTKELTIENSFPECEVLSKEPIFLSGSEGGTTVRFLLPLLALGSNSYELPLKGLMAQRPMENLVKNLQNNGAFVHQGEHSIQVKGPLRSNCYFEVDCSKTTQFASALLHLKIRTEIEIRYDLGQVTSSQAYLDLTNFLIEQVKTNNKVEVSPDFSSLGYFIAYALLNQKLTITNVKLIDSLQADAKIFDVLNQIGVLFKHSEKGLTILPISNNDTYFEIDGATCIDLVPTLIFVASFLKGTSKISNLKYLKYKECDRLKAMKNMMNHIGVDYSYDDIEDILTIVGAEKYPKISELETEDDHRMIMVAALFLKKIGGGNLTPFTGVKKSFPSFFSVFNP